MYAKYGLHDPVGAAFLPRLSAADRGRNAAPTRNAFFNLNLNLNLNLSVYFRLTGSSTVNSVPSPTLLFTWISPLCRLTML